MAVLARRYEEITARGATVAGIVVDSPGQNAAMTAKLALPFPLLSDPDGIGAIKPFGAWDEARPMARPAIVALSSAGDEVYRYVGVDFMDRPPDDEILAALDTLALPPLPTVTGVVPHMAREPGPRAMQLRDLGIYLRGVRYASGALADRAHDPRAKQEAERTSAMAEAFLKAHGATLPLTN